VIKISSSMQTKSMLEKWLMLPSHMEFLKNI
jgi:hypothetical protein